MTTEQQVAAYNTAQAEVKRLWNLVCQEMNVDPTSTFVVFAAAYPHALEYNEAMAAFQKICKQIKKNEARRAILTDLGLKRVKGSLGGIYYE